MLTQLGVQPAPMGTPGRHALEAGCRYVLSVLCGMDGSTLPAFAESVHYGTVEDAPEAARLVIEPSPFFQADTYGTEASVPQLPLDHVMGVPLLFGSPEITRQDDRIVTSADLIASAYFLLTRYEEAVRPDVRDEHGRFPGGESLPCRGGFLDRPVVDEYAGLLQRWLGQLGIEIPKRPSGIRKVYLTHDVDIPWRWGHLGTACRASASRVLKRSREPMEPLLCYFGVRKDPMDCFDWMLDQDMSLVQRLGPDRVETIVFMMAGGVPPRDGYYRIHSRRTASLLRRLMRGGAAIGLHASYEAGCRPAAIPCEVAALAKAVGRPITDSRHHFLACREPEDLAALEQAGIRRDFTMAYADVAGFRLGTCRGVKWFDLQENQVTDLTLYPMTLMDCTLDRPDYMGLDYEQAHDVSGKMLEHIRRHNGDAVLLWHNTELTDEKTAGGSYQKRLYAELLKKLGG